MIGDNNFDFDRLLKTIKRFSTMNEIERKKTQTTNETIEKPIDIDSINVHETEDYELLQILESVTNDEKVRLFDKIVEKLKNNPDESYRNNNFILCLPPEVRIKYAEYYDFETLDSTKEFIKGMTNEEDIFNSAKIALNKTKNCYSVIRLFSNVPYNKKVEFLKLIAEKEKELQMNIIDRYNISDFLKEFKLEHRLDVIKNSIFKDFQVQYEEGHSSRYSPNVRFDNYSYVEILSAFTEENPSQSKMFETLVFLIDESKKIRDSATNEIVGISNPEKIIELFYKCGYNPNQLLEFMLNNGAIEDKYALCDIGVGLPLEIKKEIINFAINFDNGIRKTSQFEFFSMLDNLPLDEASNFFVKYCITEKRFDYFNAITRFQNEGKHSAIDYLNIIFKYLSPEELTNSFEGIKIAFAEMTAYPKYDEKYNLIVSVFSKKNNVDENKVLLFAKKFGFNILKYLENENIKKFINMDSQNLEKLFSLFDESTIIINKQVINDILNSLLQRQFMLEEHATYNIFSMFENLIQNNDLNGINELLEKISKEFDYSSILQKNNCSHTDLYNQIVTGNLDLLHAITNAYIAYKREVFVKEKLLTIDEMLTMEKVITRDSYKNDMIESHGFSIANYCQQLIGVNFTEEQKFLIYNDKLMWELIQFKKNPKENNLRTEYRKYLKTLNELLEILYDNKYDLTNYKPNYPFCQHLKFELIQGEISMDFLIGILLESNYQGVINVLSNDDNYASLKTYLEKYKIIGWQDIFTKLMAKADIEFDESTVASFISNYDKIKSYIDNKTSLTSVIDHANCYAATSNFYRILFGTEDYNLLTANSGKNKASMPKYNRLNGCSKLVPLMYTKEFFTVPTVDENFKLNNGKDIKIVLGNSTNMMNLTYGERTDACMRKGGAFDSLFEHCATDKNGFHIRFVNPKTNNFVSRVSGTRNGNTIFLNELRYSLDSEYSNEDLFEAIKMFSKHLIQLSKDSKLPIDNVIITSDYALEEHENENQNLNLSPEEKKEALRGVKFNFSDSGILLSNSKNDNKIVPYVFTDEVPLYASVRDTPKVYRDKNALNRMLQIRIINDLINGVMPENINTEYSGVVPDYVISGEDYYIAFIKENAYIFVLDSCKENPRTIEEINCILKNNTNILDTSIQNGVNR